MVASACLFIFGFATTWAPGVWIIIGESFAPRTRAKQSSLATASNWLWNFLISFFTPFITGSIQYSYGFVFAGCASPFFFPLRVGRVLMRIAGNLFAAVFVFFFLYESSDLPLESVDLVSSPARFLSPCSALSQMYNDPNCKPWTSGRWSQPGAGGLSGRHGTPMAEKGHFDHSGPTSASQSVHAA
jgi:SP family sugar:H+ symporter-like MFS transporter